MKEIKNKIFVLKNEEDFNDLAFKIFHYQYEQNRIYKEYCNYLKIDPGTVKQIYKIPFLPVEFFKRNKIVTANEPYDKVFTSSGTTGDSPSVHYVKNYSIYEKSFIKTFESFYGNITDYCILALLPSYLERQGSSLVNMASKLIELSKDKNSGFFLNEYEKLSTIIEANELQGKKTLLLGVTFALLEFADFYKFKLKNTIIMETGGMKGRKKEITRAELHEKLCGSFGAKEIHGEYGMTELLSQAYSKRQGRFFTPPWMKVLIRDQYDPFTYLKKGLTGGINIIDLANIYSCSFIETKDLGHINENGSFEVAGRFDNSDIRGCNLLIG